MSKKYYLWPLGCAQNMSDAERVATVLEKNGYTITSEEKEADVIVVLACSVRQSAIDRIYGRSKIWRKNNKGSLKILSGCVLPKDMPKMEKIFDIIFEIKDLQTLPHLIGQKWSKEVKRSQKSQSLTILDDSMNSNQNTPLRSKLRSCIRGTASLWYCKANALLAIQPRSKLRGSPPFMTTSDKHFNYLSISPKHSNSFQASVPISNGCDNFCTYCAVPYTRGREVSRPFDEIVKEVKDLVKNGYKEVTLLGQNVNSYHLSQINTDLKRINTDKKSDFLILLKELDKIPGKFWIRFISNHPKDFPDELLMELPKLQKVAPYIHLPVQSGSNVILKAMNRKYTREEFLGLVGKIRKNIPNVAISTDTIVGFPGETKKDFEETIEVYKKSKFDMAYISQYSPRPGTVSAKKEDDVPRKEKVRRDKELNEVLKKTALENNKKYVGKTVEVLVEKEYKGYLWGRTDAYKLVKLAKGETLGKQDIGNFTKIKIKSATPWTLSDTAPNS